MCSRSVTGSHGRCVARSAWRWIVLVVVAAACDLNVQFGGPPYLIVLPRVVHVRATPAGVTNAFTLSVVSEDAAGAPLPTGVLTWSASPAVATFLPSGTEVLVTLDGGRPSGEVIRISASNGTLLGDAYLVVVASEPAPTPDDEVRASHTPNDPPVLALLSGQQSGNCVTDQVRSFVMRVPIERWDGSAGCARSEASVFSVGRRPLLKQPMGWTPAREVVDATTAGAPIPIPLRVVIGVSDSNYDDALTKVNNGLTLTESVLRNTRAGLSVPASAQVTIRQALDPAFNQCAGIPSLPTNVKPDSARLNIYVIESVDGARGMFCAPNVILLSRVYMLATTTPHEFGHALGLISPDSGHVDDIHGFARDNLMSTSTGAGTSGDQRSRLTLGQLYRMHVDGRSWIKRDAQLQDGHPLCPCDPYASSVCPMLSTDVRPVLKPLPTPLPTVCP